MTQAERNAREAHLPLSVRLCSDKAAYEALVLRRVVFSMDDAKQRLEETADCRMMVSTPHLLIFRCGRAEVTLSRDGRMLIKRVKDEDEARLVACKAWQIILRAQC